MMKKGAIFIATFLLLLLPSVIFADAKVTATDKADVVKITFTYTNPDAGEVYLPGTFNGWNPTALKMEKGANGVFTMTVEAKPTDKVQYKFYVDGSWTEDENAPAGTDDGFGGKNGLIDVAALLAGGSTASAAGGAPAAPTYSMNFQLYARSYVDTSFLTRDILVGDKSGYEFDKVRASYAMYPKITGYILPNVDIYAEFKMMDSGIDFYASNTDGKDKPFANPYDGLEKLGNALFNPIASLAGQMPELIKTKITWTTPYAVFTTAYKWYERGAYTEYEWDTYKKAQVNDGLFEISNGKEISKIAGAKTEALFGFTKQAGYFGMYSWGSIDFGALDVKVAFNSRTDNGKGLFAYDEWNKNAVFAGTSYNLKDAGLTLTLQGLYNFGNGFDSAIEAKDLIAGIAGIEYKSDMIGAKVTGQYFGDSVDQIFGDNGKSFSPSNIKASVEGSVKASILKVGAYSDYKFDNAEIAKNYINMYFRPYLDLNLTDNITLNAYGKMNLDMLDMADSAKASNQFKVTEAGIKANLNKLADVLPALKVIGAAKFDTSWNGTDKVMNYDKVYSSLTTEASLQNDMKVVFGAALRTDLRTKPAATTQAAWDLEIAKEIPYGFAAGYSWILPVAEIGKPTFAVTYFYDFNPFENNYATGLKYQDDSTDAGDTFILKDIATKGTKSSNLCIGLVWNF